MIRTVLIVHVVLVATLLTLTDASAEVIELTAPSAAPGREVALCIHRPSGPGPFPVVLFSQDVGTSCHANADLGRHWAAAGLLGVFIEHPGGHGVEWDWRARSRATDRRTLGADARIDDRAGDLRGVIDALERWNRDAAHALAGLPDLRRIGAAGEYWGATTAGVATGQRTGHGGPVLADRRIRAALLLDPIGPARLAPSAAYGAVQVPWMLVYGRHGALRHGPWLPDQIEAVWPALRGPGSYELIFRDALAPSSPYAREPRGRDRRPDAGAGDPPDAAVRRLSTAFWNATLRDDTEARRWLNGPAARDVLRAGDRWRHR